MSVRGWLILREKRTVSNNSTVGSRSILFVNDLGDRIKDVYTFTLPVMPRSLTSDPTTGAPFPGNIIPASRFDPTGKRC